MVNKTFEELKRLSEVSLTRPLTDKEYKWMMFLRDKHNIVGGKVPRDIE